MSTLLLTFSWVNSWVSGLQFPDKPNYSATHRPDHGGKGPGLPEAAPRQPQFCFPSSIRKTPRKATQVCYCPAPEAPRPSRVLKTLLLIPSQDESSSHLSNTSHEFFVQHFTSVLVHLDNSTAQKSGFQRNAECLIPNQAVNKCVFGVPVFRKVMVFLRTEM